MCFTVSAGGCSTQSYVGISLRPNDAPVELQGLAERAMGGGINKRSLSLVSGMRRGVGFQPIIAVQGHFIHARRNRAGACAGSIRRLSGMVRAAE